MLPSSDRPAKHSRHSSIHPLTHTTCQLSCPPPKATMQCCGRQRSRLTTVLLMVCTAMTCAELTTAAQSETPLQMPQLPTNSSDLLTQFDIIEPSISYKDTGINDTGKNDTGIDDTGKNVVLKRLQRLSLGKGEDTATSTESPTDEEDVEKIIDGIIDFQSQTNYTRMLVVAANQDDFPTTSTTAPHLSSSSGFTAPQLSINRHILQSDEQQCAGECTGTNNGKQARRLESRMRLHSLANDVKRIVNDAVKRDNATVRRNNNYNNTDRVANDSTPPKAQLSRDLDSSADLVHEGIILGTNSVSDCDPSHDLHSAVVTALDEVGVLIVDVYSDVTQQAMHDVVSQLTHLDTIEAVESDLVVSVHSSLRGDLPVPATKTGRKMLRSLQAARDRYGSPRRANNDAVIIDKPVMGQNYTTGTLENELRYPYVDYAPEVATSDKYARLLWNMEYIGVETAWDYADKHNHTTHRNNSTTGTDTGTEAIHIQKKKDEDENIVAGRTNGMVVIVDSGIDDDHEDLWKNLYLNWPEATGMEGVDDDGNGYVDDFVGYNSKTPTASSTDEYGHGTHVAGIIGAMVNNTNGVYGVNPNANLVPCRFMDAQGVGYVSGAVACLDYALAIGASLSNHSWSTDSKSQSLKRAIKNADKVGHILVVSAGNTGEDLDKVNRFPPAYQASNLLVVGSTGRQGTLSSFSCHSPSKVHLAAPGESIASTLHGNRYAYKTGTSMAAPHVAGVLSYMWQLRPNLASKDLIKILLGAATLTDSLKGNVKAGALDFGQAVKDLLDDSPAPTDKPHTTTAIATTDSTTDSTTPTAT